MPLGTLPTSAGPRLACELRSLTIPPGPAAALAFAFGADRLADELLANGRAAQAERLSHAAHEARCRAAGGRA